VLTSRSHSPPPEINDHIMSESVADIAMKFEVHDAVVVTRSCTIRTRQCLYAGFGLVVCLPFGAAVGDQSGDGERGVFEVFTASDVALQGPPLLGLGDGVFDADPL
jgi:hypothetical protein